MASQNDFSYYNVVDQIYNPNWVGKKLVEMQFFRELFKKLWPQGHPTQFFHVAGTSGKGSVCKYLEAGLSLVGRAGSYTNPHLFDFRERYSIQGKIVSRQEIINIWENFVLPLHIQRTRKYLAFPLHFSELSLLIALKLFEQHKVRYASIETGVGGRYHCSNVLPVQASVIVTVNEDHEDLLGETQWQRALEKGGIMKKNIPCFTSVCEPKAKVVIEKFALEVGAPLFCIEEKDQKQVEDFVRRKTPRQFLPQHQKENAALTLKIIRYFFPKIPVQKMLTAFSNVIIPGRLQCIAKDTYIDVAHNREKIQRLAETLTMQFPKQQFIFLLGLSGERNPRSVFEPLLLLASKIILTDGFHNAVTAEKITKNIRRTQKRGVKIEFFHSPNKALRRAQKIRGKQKLFITGSMYLLDAIFNPDPYLRHLNIVSNWREKMLY